jgi:DNA-binding protein HU-beta
MTETFNLENADRVGKAYLIGYLAESNGLTLKDAEKAVNGVLEAIVAALRSGANVSLANIGTFRRETAPERSRFNPMTGQHFQTEAQEVVRWTTSPTFGHVLNGRISRETLATKAPKGSL